MIIALAPDPNAAIKEARDEKRETAKVSMDRIVAVATVALAAVTAFLAFFTWRLWASTGSLVEETRANSERQLRAYVSVKACQLVPGSDKVSRLVSVHIENSGQTPAYDVRTSVVTGIQAYPLNVVLPDPPMSGSIGKRDLGSRTLQETRIGVKDFERHVDGILEEKAAIYVWGKVTYRDAFKKDQWSTFRMRLTGLDGLANGRFAASDDGNEST